MDLKRAYQDTSPRERPPERPVAPSWRRRRDVLSWRRLGAPREAPPVKTPPAENASTSTAQVYYEKKAKRKVQQRAAEAPQSQWDDEHHDYKLEMEDAFGEHYTIKERIGKGSFGQVVRARDERTGTDVAIKIIKSKKPFALQAQTEIELLRALRSADRDDKQNIVRLLDHFVYRGHECLVFEMLSYNLYELLKNTQFHGVSLNLVRKFAKQILHALAFLARPVRTRRLFPNISELHVASTASSRCRAASTPSS